MQNPRAVRLPTDGGKSIETDIEAQGVSPYREQPLALLAVAVQGCGRNQPPGSWVKLSVRWPAFSAAITKHTRRERGAGVLDRNGVHVPAVLVGTHLDDPALDRRHAVRVGEIHHGDADTGVAAHVPGFPRALPRTHEKAVILNPDPHHPIPWRAVGPQG